MEPNGFSETKWMNLVRSPETKQDWLLKGSLKWKAAKDRRMGPRGLKEVGPHGYSTRPRGAPSSSPPASVRLLISLLGLPPSKIMISVNLWIRRRTTSSEAGSLCTERGPRDCHHRSEEHTSELQSPLIISYAVFCLKKIFF